MTQEIQKAAVDRLTQEEREAFDSYMQSGRPALNIETSLKMFGLFVQGTSCEEIARLNPNFSLGLIVRARVEHLWDAKKDAYIADLYDNAGSRLRQTAMESVNFLGDLLAAAHKLHGERIKKFLQTGDPADLGDLKIGSIKQYKDVIETLAKISGQDSKKEVRHTGEVTSVPAVLDTSNMRISPGVAAKILKAIADDDEEKKD